jgi:hypothetical protein
VLKLKGILKLLYPLLIMFAIKNNQHNKKKYIYFQCSKCKNIITFENPQNKNIFIDCPICVKEGIVGYSKTKKTHYLFKKLVSGKDKSIETKYFLYKPLMRIKNTGLIFIILGMFFLIYPTAFHIKLASTFIIIGGIILGLLPDNRYFFIRIKDSPTRKYKTLITKIKTNDSMKNKINNIRDKFDISEKIAIAMIILIVILYLITGVNNFEIYLVFIYLGLLIVKELSVEFMPDRLKKRMNVFIVIFLLIFLVIIIKKITNFINI